MSTTKVELSGVPETLLWTLHNRAAEAKRRDSYLPDPDCIRIYDSIAYDFERSFGKADDSHPMRSRICDEKVRAFMAAHPRGTIVELACGLETEFSRCDDGRVQWVCVDVPEAMEVRERFLPASERCTHVARSALDLAWIDDVLALRAASGVDADQPVMVTAQGLLMYFEEADVKRLFVAMAEAFPRLELVFDTIPRWFSQKTLRGFGKTRHYVAPKMPWGVDRSEIRPLLERWSTRVREVSTVAYGTQRGVGGTVLRWFSDLPVLREIPPCIVHVKTQG